VLFLGDMIGAIRVLLVHVLVKLCHLLIVDYGIFCEDYLLTHGKVAINTFLSMEKLLGSQKTNTYMSIYVHTEKENAKR